MLEKTSLSVPRVLLAPWTFKFVIKVIKTWAHHMQTVIRYVGHTGKIAGSHAFLRELFICSV
jgi:hypothetical protein